MNLSGKRVSCPLSGGINSAAVLCWLMESNIHPSELHLWYADFKEHSPDTLQFVMWLMELAKRHFKNVVCTITDNSALDFFEEQKFIPHPTDSPCSNKLKIEPMLLYNSLNNIEVDLIGYVRTEKQRMKKNKGKNDLFLTTYFPIKEFDDEWCFDIVDRVVGWHPEVYNHKWNDSGFVAFLNENLHRLSDEDKYTVSNKIGKDERVFKHNNCLPCKNMTYIDLLCVEYFYPQYLQLALDLSQRIGAFWGRDKDTYYTTFGRNDWEGEKCGVCSFN